MMQTKFNGFSKEAIDFLIENRMRNDKSWFEENRTHYESLLLNPFRGLAYELAPLMMSIEPDFETRPAINKTISKIYRDTRFSKDKSLFRDTMWLIFKRPNKNWSTETPGFFFEIMPDGWRYGMGFYTASRPVMDQFRQAIDNNPDRFKKVIQFNKDGIFNLNGECYKRQLPSNHDEEIDAWYQRKTFYLSSNHNYEEAIFYSGKLIGQLLTDFQILAPLFTFIRNSQR